MNRREILLGAIAAALASRFGVATPANAVDFDWRSHPSIVAEVDRVSTALLDAFEQFRGKPFSRDVLEQMLATADAFFRHEVGEFAGYNEHDGEPLFHSGKKEILGGRVWFEPGTNSAEDLRDGRITFFVEAPISPMSRTERGVN